MALFDFLKRKKNIEKSKKPVKQHPAKAPVKKEDKKEAAPKGSSKEAVKAVPAARKAGKEVFSFEAVKRPHISEKATYLSEKDQYVFEVLPGYNKKEIKSSIEGIYNVDVLSVNLIKIPAKKRRLGRTQGFRKAYIKAIVKIKPGQKIEIL